MLCFCYFLYVLQGCVLISEVLSGGAAANDGRLLPGDQILEMDSEDFRKATHGKAIHALRQCISKVFLPIYLVLKDTISNARALYLI